MSLVVIIRAVTGLIIARYARPRSHIPLQGGHCGSQVSTHWDTRHKMHHMSSSQQRAHLQGSQSTSLVEDKYICTGYRVFNEYVVWPSLVLSPISVRWWLSSASLLTDWVPLSAPRLRVNGPGPGGTQCQEQGSSRWNVVAGKSINLFFTGASWEKQTWVSWSCM